MAGVNKAILVGNVGKGPELRATPNGKSTCSFSLATNESWKDGNGQKQEKTEWHNIVLWGKSAEIAHQYVKKGTKLYVEGRIQTRSWEKDGQKKYITEIVASDFQILTPRGDKAAKPAGIESGAAIEFCTDAPGDEDVPF